MAEKKYLDQVGLQDVATHVNTRLKTVTTIPVSADNGAVRLYVGTTTATYIRGHIYQYNSTDSEWVDITNSYTAGNGININENNEISADTVIFTGTQAEWDALTTAQKQIYDICNITDDDIYPIGDINLSRYIEKSSTSGLLKNDGTVDSTIQSNVTNSKKEIKALYDGETDGLKHIGVFVNGSWTMMTSSPSLTTPTNRIRPNDWIYVKAGDTIKISTDNGAYVYSAGYYSGTLSSFQTIRNDNVWQTKHEDEIYAYKDGFFMITFADASNTSTVLDPNAFTGSIEITSCLTKTGVVAKETLDNGYCENYPCFNRYVDGETTPFYSEEILTRIGTDLRFLKKGSRLVINSGSLKYAINIYNASKTTRLCQLWWHKKDDITVQFDCWYALSIAKEDTSQNVSISDFDGYIREYPPFENNASVVEFGLMSGLYLRTGSGNIGEVVDIDTPSVYDNYGYCITPCTATDTFVVTGRGGGTGRLWAFLDADKKLISRSDADVVRSKLRLETPSNAAYFIANVATYENYHITLYKDYYDEVDPQSKIIPVTVYDMPEAIVKPTIEYQKKIGEDNISRVKGTIYKNGDYYCVIYNENLDGNTNDYPQVDGTGVLAIRYKYFKLVDGVETEVSYGEIAKKGSTYTDWQNNSATFQGGTGLPSGTNGKQYFTGVYTGTRRYNNFNNYGMTPCCVDVTVSSSGVTFGDVKELSLTINGVKGAFDVYRIDPANVDYWIYYTTTPPTVDENDVWHWTQPVKNGFAYFTSDNGVDWTYVCTIKTDYQPACEVTSFVYNDNYLLFASRTMSDNETIDPDAIIGIFNTSGALTCQYRFNCKSTRVYLSKDYYGFIMTYNPRDWRESTFVRIVVDGVYHLFFERWFSIYHNTTWYVSIERETIKSSGYPNMYLIGSNGSVGSGDGLDFTVLHLDNSPRTISSISASIG